MLPRTNAPGTKTRKTFAKTASAVAAVALGVGTAGTAGAQKPPAPGTSLPVFQIPASVPVVGPDGEIESHHQGVWLSPTGTPGEVTFGAGVDPNSTVCEDAELSNVLIDYRNLETGDGGRFNQIDPCADPAETEIVNTGPGKLALEISLFNEDFGPDVGRSGHGLVTVP